MLDGMLGGLPHRTSEVMHGAAERARAGRTVAAARAQARLPLLVGLGAAGLWGGYSLHQRQDTSDRAFMAGTWALALLVTAAQNNTGPFDYERVSQPAGEAALDADLYPSIPLL